MLLIVLGSAVYAVKGVKMHKQVDVEEAAFHELQDSYFSQAKSIRDSAATDSDLNADLVTLQQTPSELLRLKLVGVGKILSGIYLLLLAILMALVMMPVRLGVLLKKKE